ncbi:MAG TPA: AAA family ATPase [Chthoniobacteraceae bacterium]|nr:AAA family ATPase [Chthoniobacteraceae bacterium]
MSTPARNIVRLPAEILFARELDALRANDTGRRPAGWNLSPTAVRQFITGTDAKAYDHDWEGKRVSTPIRRKYYGNDALLDRCIVTLLGNRGLLLVGEPGTAKSMLSELLTAAISGISTNVIQGTAGTTEDQIKYSWNYALLLAEGPSPRALVPSPLYTGMKKGLVVRFEEITRCQPEIQDALVSVLSDKILPVAELSGDDGVVFAEKGFNILATANLRDRGVNEMSSALKRRFNFETVNPITDRALELQLVIEQTELLLREADVKVDCGREVMEILVTTFHDLRVGRTSEGTVVEKPSTVMSTAEAVAVGLSAGLDAAYFGSGKLESEHIARQLSGTVLKDNPDDAKKLVHYFDVVVKNRARKNKFWQAYWDARKWLEP